MALIPSFYLDCVVAIGTTDEEGNHHWIASGFLYGVRLPENEPRTYQVFLVTNRHVLDDLPHAYLRFNPQADKRAQEFELSLFDDQGQPLWYCHPEPEVDIAVMPVNFDLLEERGMQVDFFKNDQNIATIDEMNELGVTEGDFTYVLGFPMGLVGDYRNAVIVRSGTIARIRDVLTKLDKTFLVDAFVFPGNSGGPVILKPEAIAIEGTKAPNASLLIGIVRAYVPYEDVAVSLQTRRTRVVFEENSGLAAVQPVDFIEETWRGQFKPPIARKPIERKRPDAE
jgi:S1-C subfamily serine protease